MLKLLPAMFVFLISFHILAIQESRNERSANMEAFRRMHALEVFIPIDEITAKPITWYVLSKSLEYAPLDFIINLDRRLVGYEILLEGLKAHKNGDHPRALKLFLDAASTGLIVEAQYLSGSMLLQSCVKKDQEYGMELLQSAANSGSMPAAYDLTMLSKRQDNFLYPSYLNEECTKKIKYLVAGLKFAKGEKNSWKAINILNRVTQKSKTRIDSSAEELYILGHVHLMNKKSQDQGIKNLRSALNQGFKPAALDLGLIFLTGKGVAKNLELAASYFNRYPEDPKFKYHRGLALFFTNLPDRKAIGIELIEQAAENGYSLAEKAVHVKNL